MKKVVIMLIIVIIIIAGGIGFMYWRARSMLVNNHPSTENIEANYGNRGNISQAEKIKFLSKNDEYLVGMMGVNNNNQMTRFSDDDMIRFCLNVAVTRYRDMLTKSKEKDGTNSFLVQTSVINSISDEYFGIKEISFDADKSEYYSKTNKAFILKDEPKISLYYYPVERKEILGRDIKGILVGNENNGEETEIIFNEEEKYIELTVDTVFINDNYDNAIIDNVKFEGKYNSEDVDSVVKFVFNSAGKLVAYQYV